MGIKNVILAYLSRQYNQIEATHYQPSPNKTLTYRKLRLPASLQDNNPSKKLGHYTLAVNPRFYGHKNWKWMKYKALLQAIRLLVSKKYRTKYISEVRQLIQDNPELQQFLIDCYISATKNPSKKFAFAICYGSNALVYGIQEGNRHLFVKTIHGDTN
jgi:hypothetical protein